MFSVPATGLNAATAVYHTMQGPSAATPRGVQCGTAANPQHMPHSEGDATVHLTFLRERETATNGERRGHERQDVNKKAPSCCGAEVRAACSVQRAAVLQRCVFFGAWVCMLQHEED